MATKVDKIGDDTIHIHCPFCGGINAVTIDDKGEPHVISYMKEKDEPTPKPADDPKPKPTGNKSILFGE